MFDYSKQQKNYPPCPICHAQAFTKLATNDRYNMGIRTVGCNKCGLVQTWPRLTQEVTELFYRKYYRQFYQSVVEPELEYLKRYHKLERLRYTSKLIVSEIEITSGMRILDVGCAEGSLFSALLEEIGGPLNLVGVEPNECYAEYAKNATGCSTYANLQDLIDHGEQPFDVVIINHVLEHVDDPISFLQSIRALLNISGKIYIDVPSVGQYSSTKDIHIAHLYHFSPNTLGFLLEQSGLKMLKMEEHAPPFHPKSLWSISTFNHAITRGGKYSFSNDRVGWQQVRKLNRAMPLYLFSRPLIKALLPVRSSIKKYFLYIFSSHT